MHATTSLLPFLLVLAAVPAQTLTVALTPKGGKPPVEAAWTPVAVPVDTDFGSASVKGQELAQIVFGEPDVVTTRGGTELRGKVKLTQFQVKVDGKARRFGASELESFVVADAIGGTFAGEWMTSFGPMTLTQQGIAVEGSYGFGDGLAVKGKIENGALVATYESGNGSGTCRFEVQEDGEFLRGEYASGSDKGFWGGYRKAPKVAAAAAGTTALGQTKAGMRYHVRLPKAHAEGKRWPAICILHGSNMTSRAYVDTIALAWPELAEQFVVVGLDGERCSPAGKPGAPAFNYTYVNFGGPDVGPPFAHRQSPALVAESLEELQQQLPVERWYLGGHSQGGFLTYAVLMYYPQLLAGAFPMSCNLLVQCEPDNFTGNKAQQQHRVPVAVVHGKRDDVVEFQSGAYCHLRLLDGGFPFVRQFAPANVGHQFALLPVDAAVRWLHTIAAGEPEALVAFAEQRAKDGEWRDVGAALQRLDEAKAPAPLRPRIDAVQKQLDAAAAPELATLQRAMVKHDDGAWVDDFLRFRARFATAACAAPLLAIYDELRRQQQKTGDELFYKARGLRDKGEREAIYAEIMKTCWATKWYECVKLWTGK